jgi:hypothetical protein
MDEQLTSFVEMWATTERSQLAETCIAYAATGNGDGRLTSLLATLLLESCDHNPQTAVQRLQTYIEQHPTTAANLQALRTEITNRHIPPELKQVWTESYQLPLQTLQNEVRGKWMNSVMSAQVGLWLRLSAGLAVCVIGLWLLWHGGLGLADTAVWPQSFLQISLGLILLLISLVRRGPVRDIQQTLAEIGVANTVYATHAQQRLHVSYQHTALSLQNRLTTADLIEYSQLLGNAMKEAVQTLRHERKPMTLDEFLGQMEG